MHTGCILYVDSAGIHRSTYTQFQRWLQIDQHSKPAIYRQIFESAKISSLGYWLELFFAAAIATFGLVLNSPAVIIGAMLISPLMGPIMARGIAIALGDLHLSLKALLNLVASIGCSIALSAFIVWLLPFHSETAEVLARTDPNLLDLGVAVVSGLAGSVIVCKGGGGGGVTALPGVAIAVALMPPLCAMGFGFGSGGNMGIVGGAGLLFLTNIVAIVSSAFGVFLLVGMNSHEVLAEMGNVQGDDPLAVRLAHGRFGKVISGSGHVIWRILILAALLGAISVPLKRALMQVADETVARSVVQRAVNDLAPASAVVSQSINIGSRAIDVRVISAQAVSIEDVRRAEQFITDKTNRKATISIEQVASRSELSEILSRLNTPPVVVVPPKPAPPPPKTLDEIRQELLTRVTPILSEVWPAEAPSITSTLLSI